MTTTQTARTSGDIVRGLGATLALLAFVAGVPLALVALAPVYLPDPAPTWERLWQEVTSPDNGTLLLAVLAAVAWLAWAAFSASVVVEFAASARRLSAPSIPLLGGFQRTASRLIATAALLLATATTITAPATPAAASVIVVPFDRPAPAAPGAGPTGPTMESTPTTPTHEPQISHLPTVVVQRGDTLWDIAEHHLGDPMRYTEIRDLNLGRAQPDGRYLHDADWILPGWTLLLPADATNAEHTVPVQHAGAAPTTGTTAAATIVVKPGDTLWDIAEMHFGDGNRYPEIADLNRGVTQPDGGHLTDADLIRPGWLLRLPMTAPAAKQAGEPLEPAGTGMPSAAQSPVPSVPPTSAPRHAATLDETPSPAPSPPVPAADGTVVANPAVGEVVRVARPVNAWFLGLTALGAGGVVGELARRRHLQQRARRVGEAIPMPEPSSQAAAAERTLRAAATPVSIEAIRTTLNNLACRCFDAGRELPRIGGLLLDEHQLTLLVLDDAPEPIAPFTARDPRTWVATTADVAAEQPIDDPDQGIPYPLLVTLGHTEDATLVVNLEAAGTLSVVGDATAADEALRALVIEAATSDLASQMAIHTDETFADLADAFEDFRLRATDSRDNRVAWVATVTRLLEHQGLDDVLQARGDRELEDIWLPVAFVERTLQSPPSAPWSGVVTLTRQPVDEGWTLHVDTTGMARLEPLGITFQPQRMTDEHVDQLRSLLITSLPPEPHPENPPQPTSADQDAAALAVAHPVLAEPKPRASDVQLNLLGPIQVLGVPGRPLTRRTVEVLAYLALHGPATGPDLDEMIWQGERGNPNTRNVFINRARERLGKDVLPRVGTDGLFHLGQGVTTDWNHFQQRLSRAVTLDGQECLDELTAAMCLVRDRPFRGIAPAAYVWADHDIQQMISAITDTAHLLARLHYEAGRHRDAIKVATVGLLVEPCTEQLQKIAIDATNACSGPEQAKALRRRYSQIMARLDPELA